MYFVDPVKKKYPNITVERIDNGQKGQTLEELVVAGTIPDLVLEAPLNLSTMKQLGIDSNIEDLIKKYKFDLNRVQPEHLESIKVGTFNDYLGALPIYNNYFGLFYNKDLFDKFGVAYPKENLTWDEVRTMAAKLTRTENGTDYVGLHPNSVFWGAYQLGLPFIDTVNDKAVYQTAGWKELLEMWAQLYVGPGGQPIPTTIAAVAGFQKGQVAMTMGYTDLLASMSKVQGLNWDITTYPINPKAPGVGQRVDSYNLAITSKSKNRDAAFQVIEVLLSDDVQQLMSRNGRSSVLKDRKIQDQFGQGVAEYQKKNVVALTKLKLAVVKPFKYAFPTNPASLISASFNDLIYNGKDVNTVLREADEKLNKQIQDIVKK
jgi:multiple sugar transport system substrate-binding protein